jgi:3-oxoacyl-[acyl-carrier protein] reductase
MGLSLKGKVAMVAGASKGQGFAIGKALAQEGAFVPIVSRDSAAISVAVQRVTEGGAGVAFGFVTDVRSPEGIIYWHRATVEQHRAQWFLANSAPGYSPQTSQR